MISGNDQKGAAVKFPPPIIFLTVMLAAYGFHNIFPVGVGSVAVLMYIGVFLMVAGVGVVVLAGKSFKQAKTNIEPWKPTTQIISAGIYGYSRNPIYVAFCLVQIGAGIALNSFWVLISFIISAVAVYYIAIKKEEAYLESKFGEEYLSYKNKVRRWL